MNEFEALKRLRQETCPATYMPDFNKEECLDVIEKALLELQAIKEAKPSEALKCLKSEKKIMWAYDYDIIKQALLKAEKLEKAWEIVKEKEIDTFYLRQCFKVKDSLEIYNNCCKVGYKLTQQEFDLLKEMLE